MKKLFIKTLILTLVFANVSTAAFAWGFKKTEQSNEAAGPVYTQVAAQHILVRNAADAVQIKKEIENGGSFEYYARKYSLCPSGKNGGYLGYFGRGQMVPEFEKKAFSMEIGEISSPVRTNFGWHLIKVVDKR
ncbi:peptidyl-prolyl cis-trans isomerase [bacterium]|nr:peptidyl-prolyl cis-trans isomerase [bacterium]